MHNIKNGFSGVRVDGSSRVYVNIGDNPKLIALMLDKNPESVNDSWDKFCDSIGDFQQARGLSNFLDSLDKDNELTKTILYNLNTSQNALFAT